jgi:hypothetical protein
VVILLMVISSHSIGGYWWLLVTIGDYCYFTGRLEQISEVKAKEINK